MPLSSSSDARPGIQGAWERTKFWCENIEKLRAHLAAANMTTGNMPGCVWSRLSGVRYSLPTPTETNLSGSDSEPDTSKDQSNALEATVVEYLATDVIQIANASQNLCVSATNLAAFLEILMASSTGVTGYIAGDAVYAIDAAYPDIEFTFLVRTKEKAAMVQSAYPGSRVVLGDLDDSDLLEYEAATADMVLRELNETRSA